jgi:hypothetical protein
MFAYTGLTPIQMEKLAKEVSPRPDMASISLTARSIPSTPRKTEEYLLLASRRAMSNVSPSAFTR